MSAPRGRNTSGGDGDDRDMAHVIQTAIDEAARRAASTHPFDGGEPVHVRDFVCPDHPPEDTDGASL